MEVITVNLSTTMKTQHFHTNLLNKKNIDSLKWHIKCKDLLGTIATVLLLNLENTKDKKYKKEFKAIKQIVAELDYLQHNTILINK